MTAKILTINFVATLFLVVASAVGGVIAGLSSSDKSLTDFIWLLN